MVPRLGLVIGHTAASAGARGINLPSEYPYHLDVADSMVSYAAQRYGPQSQKPMELQIFLRDGVGITGAYRATDEWAADATIELHYNAASSSARGTETLSSGSPKSVDLANRIQVGLCALLGRPGKSRGVKIRNRQNKDRGWLSLVSGQAPAILTEPAFGSNSEDALLLRNKKFEIGRVIIDQAHRFFFNGGGAE